MTEIYNQIVLLRQIKNIASVLLHTNVEYLLVLIYKNATA